MIRRRWLQIALPLLLSACATRPAAPPPATALKMPAMQNTLAQAARAGGIQTAAWPRTDWWRAFNDPILNRLMPSALHDNPDLKRVQSRVRAARQLIRYRAGALLPHLDASASILQQRYARDSIHGVLNGRTFVYGIVNPLEFDYHLDLWGRDAADEKAAIGLARAQSAELAQARLLLSAAVARNYFALVAASESERLTRDMHDKLASLLHLARLRARAGLDPQLSVHRNEIRLDETTQALAALHSETRLLRDTLAMLAGRGPDWGQTLPVAAGTVPDPLSLPADIPLELLARRPDIVAARWRVEAAASGVQVARAAFYPDLDLKFFAGWDSIRLGDLLDPANLGHAIGPAIHLPIFEGGKLRAQLGLRQADYDAAVESYNSRLLRAVRQVADALARWQAARAQLAAQQEAVRSAAANARLAASRFASGIGDRMQMLNAAYTLDTQYAKRAMLEAAKRQAAVALVEALGGGYHDPDPH